MLRDQTVKCAKFCGQFPNWGPDPTGELDTFSTSSGRVEIPNPLNSPPNPQRHFNSYFDAFMFKELNDDDNDDLTTTLRRPHDDLTTTSRRPHDDLTTISWRSHDDLMTTPRRPHDDLMTTSRWPHDDPTTTLRPPHDDLTTSQRPHDDDDGDMDMTTSSTSSTSHNDDDDEMMTIIP